MPHKNIEKRDPCVLQRIEDGRYFAGLGKGASILWVANLEDAVVHPRKGWIVSAREHLLPVKVVPVLVTSASESVSVPANRPDPSPPVTSPLPTQPPGGTEAPAKAPGGEA